MNIVAWHDIQNKITGLRGYVELSKDLVGEGRAREYLMKEESILKTIDASIRYTKEYQEMGTRPMQWVNIPATITSVLSLIDKRDITLCVELDDLFLYCDPVIERVFSHLVENTINHGKKATAIRMWYEESPSGLVLIYTDDGVGIPADSKESIFVRDVGRGSGFSLYFIHDILELSGMSIRESGEPGRGTRFEISVPKGSYRIGAKK
jgi:signal transduction histidine kinase